MEVCFLGTGTSQGIPVIGCPCKVCASSDPRDQRLRTSIFIKEKGVSILIDIGPDFRQQMLQNQIQDIDCVLITHEHNDHIIGLDDIRPINFIHQKSMPMYGKESVLNQIKSRFEYAFAESKYPGAPVIELLPIRENELVSIRGVDILPIPIQHGMLSILGYQIGDLVYITDASKIDDSVVQLIHGCEVLVINALHHRKHHSHFNLSESLENIKRIQPVKAYLTHVSHAMGLTAEWNNQLTDNVESAYDGLRITL